MAKRKDAPHDQAAAAAETPIPTSPDTTETGTTPAAETAGAIQESKSQAEASEAKPEIKSKIRPEPKSEMPRAAQLGEAAKPEAPIRNLPVLHKQPAREKPRGRFALLAATVALAACGGAIAGSLGTAGLERLLAPAPAAPARVAQDQPGGELKALKESVAQLRVATRHLGDSLTAVRASMSQSGTATAGQLAKISEAVERIERRTAELRAAQAAPAPAAAQAAAAPDITGSVTPPAPAAAARPVKPIVPGWTLRRVIDGGALVGGPFGVIEIEPGETVPGLGRIEEIRREDGRWVVVTRRGLIVPR